MNDYNIDPNYLIKQQKIINDLKINKPTQNINKNQGPSFQDVLSNISKNELKFSKHAIERLQSRNINLSTSDIEQISKAVDKANEKGVRDALILMGNKAFVASVKNKTIITAAAEEQLKDNVFTKIDGAVII